MDKLLEWLKRVDIPTLIIFLFLVALFVLAAFTEVSIPSLLSDSIRRIGMNGVLVLAMVPTIRVGTGPNFGLPVGIIGGLLGALISMQLGLAGFTGFWAAILFAVLICLGIGLGYGWLLERVRGQEMMVGTYMGYSVVAFMSIMWLMLPSGLLLFFAGVCFLVHLFFRTRIGLSIDLVGQNERYAISSGVNPNKARLVAVILSTVLAGVGIIVYAQSYGFLQLYQAPLFMTFPAVASILIGGASIRRASVRNVIIGTAIFQTLLTISLPVLSQVTRGDITEVMRLIVSNGMILYALTRTPKEAR